MIVTLDQILHKLFGQQKLLYRVGCLVTLFQAITLSVALTFQKAVAIIPFNVVMVGNFASTSNYPKINSTVNSRGIKFSQENSEIKYKNYGIVLLFCYTVYHNFESFM